MKSRKSLAILLACLLFGIVCVGTVLSANIGLVDYLHDQLNKPDRVQVHLIKQKVMVPEWQETVYVEKEVEQWDRQQALDRANLLVATR